MTYNQPLNPTPARKRNVAGVAIIIGIIVLSLCCVGGLIINASSDDKDGTLRRTGGGPVQLAEPGAASSETAVPTAVPVPKTRTIKAEDIKLGVKVTTKQCFGSAGCNVTFKMALTVDGELLHDTGKDWTITYEVRGVEGGPQIAQLTLHDDGTFEQDSYQFGQTASRGTKLSAKVTDVEAVL